MMAWLLVAGCDTSDSEEVAVGVAEIRGGTVVPTGALDAVGTTPGCTATLISQTAALTAAHCICNGSETTELGEAPTYTCLTQSSFTFRNVVRIDDPATAVDESATRGNVTMTADVVVYPGYTMGHWLANDYALLLLHEPAYTKVVVEPIQVERPTDPPVANDFATIVGYGGTDANGGDDCAVAGGGIKRRADLTVTRVAGYDVDDDGDSAGDNEPGDPDELAGRTIAFVNAIHGACPGDSGGPALSGFGRIIGVASHAISVPATGVYTESAYDATYPIYDWIAAHACAPFDPAHPEASFCTDPMCPCGPGEGDCDPNTSPPQCASGLSCHANTGETVGLPASYDVCGPVCALFDPAHPDPELCGPGCPCDLGEGDCDTDGECAGNLICGNNNGPAFGLPASYEVCIRPGPPCGNGQPDPGEVCDDGNTSSGDGCSPTCKREVGWNCPQWNHCEPQVSLPSTP